MNDLEAAMRQRLLLRLQQLSLGGRGPLPSAFSPGSFGDASGCAGGSGAGSGTVLQIASGDSALAAALAERGYRVEDIARLSLAELEPLSQRVSALLRPNGGRGVADDSDSRCDGLYYKYSTKYIRVRVHYMPHVLI